MTYANSFTQVEEADLAAGDGYSFRLSLRDYQPEWLFKINVKHLHVECDPDYAPPDGVKHIPCDRDTRHLVCDSQGLMNNADPAANHCDLMFDVLKVCTVPPLETKSS